jgi:hypothetical protein
MPGKRKTAFVFFLPILALVGGAAEVDPHRYLDDVKYLASPEMRGRGTGTPELEKAAAFIANQFRRMGLQPLDGKCPAKTPRSCKEDLANYYQEFPVTTNAKLGPGNRLEFADAGEKKTLHFEDDFIPFNFSAPGKVSGPVVFAGYGITAPEYGYDDYSGIDAKGKIVLILRHEPQEFDEKSVFAGKLLTVHAQFWSKAANAKRHGAAAVILINDRANHSGERDDLEAFGRTVGPMNAGIPFVQIKAGVAQDWLQDAGQELSQIQQGIDKDLKPRSIALTPVQVTMEVDVERETKTVHNVAAYLPGQTSEYIVIGAHYDHLGLGEQFSMSPNEVGTPHLGADDNASGTAGVIELARWFTSQPKHRRGILFLAFAGEELGLLGSSYYVNNPELPLDHAAAMINLDMIGRLRDQKIYIGGAATGTQFRSILDPLIRKHNFQADFSGADGYGSSDHTSFTTRQVPVLFFFTGLHSDYHRPSDTWDKINATGAAGLLDMVAEAARQLLDSPDRPQFVRAKVAHGGEGAGSGGGYGPYFGSVPDFGEVPAGVKFADIKDGSPAAKAGLRAGDVLVEFDGKPMQNLYDFTYALRVKKPGDRVKVKALRGAETVSTEVTLEERK